MYIRIYYLTREVYVKLFINLDFMHNLFLNKINIKYLTKIYKYSSYYIFNLMFVN